MQWSKRNGVLLYMNVKCRALIRQRSMTSTQKKYRENQWEDLIAISLFIRNIAPLVSLYIIPYTLKGVIMIRYWQQFKGSIFIYIGVFQLKGSIWRNN